ncbi:copper amine oxidase N-terminal domain-containing protein [Paenibacillus alkaliterrae]|uniref:copper amine oxidase N-terminal domain-containing protein n=1 Tax=Paenibacillus alkaliterrae TaxID=320909 RepID=UPI001F1CE969|nr:copper amine oxidase N-terminal domain-containing protein [Paenibacillus alkaliterrae]MCF2937877.1 copper amine oxidase N-terminal domain-containing protein [Paenibacillus alkaliterrae]
MKNFGSMSRLLALLLAFALVFVAGCQAVSNVDFNTVLKNALKVTSTEGKQAIELKLLLDEAVLEEMPEEEQALIKLFSSVKLQLNNVKVQDTEHLSFDGSLMFGDATSIAFSLKMSDTLAVLELEGAKQPFVLDLTSESLLELTGMAAAVEETEASEEIDQESLNALGRQMLDTVGDYVIDNLPNPDRIAVKPAVEPINGSATSLMHVHIDLDGPEIWAWVKKYVDALVADRAGLEEMLEGIFEILQSNPEVLEAAGIVNPLEDGGRLDAPTPEETLEQATEELAVLLEELQAELVRMEKEDQETLDEVFTKDLVIKADVFVDGKLDIRKQVYELTYVLSEESASEPEIDYEFDSESGYGLESEWDSGLEMGAMPFKGLSLKMESESWNVNGEVKAAAPAASDSAIPAEELFLMEGYQVLKQFDESSVIYDLLKNKMHIGKQEIVWYPYENINPAILTAANITIIPLRDTADELGASLTYDAKTKSIELFDEATNSTVAVKVGSDTAVVNGKIEKWSFPVTLIDGVTYVPARDLARVLYAKISWTTFYDEEKVFTLEREV